jgi:hypothetical protein
MKKHIFPNCVLLLAMAGMTQAQEKPASYPKMAPIAQYQILKPQDEIALARSAAPPSISADAEVLVLGRSGYETAVKGKNGFVCFVERSWTAGFDDPEFWNPKLRAPNCFNPPAVSSVLPQYIKRTEWALAGMSRQQMMQRTQAAISNGSFQVPAPGSFSFMLSKDGYVSDDAGPWLPHVMFFIPHGQASVWGAGQAGSPVLGKDGCALEPTVLFVPVRRWSDGTPALPVREVGVAMAGSEHALISKAAPMVWRPLLRP